MSRKERGKRDKILDTASMRLSGASWLFLGATLGESAGIYRTLGIDFVDLLAIPSASLQPQLDADRIVQDPEGEARRIRDLGVLIAAIVFLFGRDVAQKAVNHKDTDVRRQNKERFYSVVEFCAQAGIPTITLLPGIAQEGWSQEKSLETAAQSLNELAGIAEEKDVTLTFEPHKGSILQSPQETLTFIQANPRLKLTLDYSQFISQGYLQNEVDPLAIHTRHVHLRQAAKNALQAQWEEGDIDFEDVVAKLKSANYTGFLTLEYEHGHWGKVDMMTETIKMRDFFFSLLAKGSGRIG
ncbi:MAG TPA: sugar phosphate isomerase/epimerase family protein [Acidobacteriota bacterium]